MGIREENIVAIARRWIDTKWQHQASLEGVATDCVGLVRGVYVEVTGITIEGEFNYPATWHLYNAEEKMYNEVKKYCEEVIPKEAAQPGDILLFGFGKGPAHHAGIMATPDTFIHAWADIKKVDETRLDTFWLRNFRAAFRMPGGD